MASPKLTVSIDPESASFREWLEQSGGETYEQFQADVVRRVEELCDGTDRIIHALMFMPAEAVQVVVGVEPPYDFELGTAIATIECDVAQNGWHYFSILELPGTGDITELRNFGRFTAESE